ncbi:MAG: RagB/SusD family nutrient uptake outer membrane protein [Chitinophagaceae bacterium]
MIYKLKSLGAATLLLIALAGCKKDYLETTPATAVSEQQIFSKVATVTSALNGAYQSTFKLGPNGRHDNYGQKSYDLANDLMGNDMVVQSAGYGWYNAAYQYNEWQVATNNRHSYNAWVYYYNIIKQANTIIANVDAVADASQTQKETIKGQALGLRAYCYFYLINYYQQTYKGNESKPGVPLYTVNATEGNGRGTVQDVYNQIVADLTKAETLLTGKTVSTKTLMDVRAVQGFRARTALLMEDWATAATYANKARTGYAPMSASQYQGGFSTISNPEWMWGAQIPADQATIYASFFSHMDINTQGYAYLGGQKKITKALYDLIPATDVRKSVFKAPGTGTSTNPDYNQLKFRVPTPGSWAADYLYMRAAEMYLIEAEALARQGQDAPARAVLQSLIVTRDPSYNAGTLSGTALLNEILLQRRIELWGEGWSLIDIKRLHTGLNRPTGAGNHNTTTLNPIVYTLPDADPKFLMRIPQAELDANTKMTPADQNP